MLNSVPQFYLEANFVGATTYTLGIRSRQVEIKLFIILHLTTHLKYSKVLKRSQNIYSN